jgi:integrase
MRHGLSDLKIRNLPKPERGQFEIWDTRLPGFGVRVSHGGAKAFVLVYRFQGRSRRMTLGRYGILSLTDARRLAHETLRAVALGEDPAAARLKARRVPEIEKFDAFVAHYVQTYARPNNRTASETDRILRREFVRHWGARPIATITKQDVLGVLDGIMAAGTHISANSALAAVRKLFNWAVERGMLERSPCQGMQKPAKTAPRDRVLTDNEVRSVWLSLEVVGYPYGPFAQILLLTGQRKGEVAGMRWTELDFRESLWSIPADRNKSDRAHVVPLTSKVLELIEGLPRSDPTLVFPTRGPGRTLHDFSRWKAELDATSKVTNWRLHDFRRTAATGMAKAGVGPHVVERILNHSTGILGGVAGVYNRFGYLPEMRSALETWQDHVLKVIENTHT